jgi:hypothetical protein
MALDPSRPELWKRRVYVATSWRNPMQPALVQVLQASKLDVYDFRHPEPGNDGFHWSQVSPEWGPDNNDRMSPTDYLKALEHPVAQEGFRLDREAMEACDTCVLLTPCGASAHLELGWFAGQDDKRTAILLGEDTVIPELMYRLVDHIAPTTLSLLDWLGVLD